MLACYHGSPNSAGLRRHLGNYRSADEGKGPGYEEVYIRYYQKLDDAYTPERNHGANLGGRDLTRPGSWSVGRANTRDVRRERLLLFRPATVSGLAHQADALGLLQLSPGQARPVGRRLSAEARGAEANPGRPLVLPGTAHEAHSVEPLKADGVEELWVDGELAIRRRRPALPPRAGSADHRLRAGVYYHGLPEKYTERNPIKVYFDNVVIAKERIGCLSPARP